MNEIAAAMGLSKPTLHHYFRSKEELLVRLYSDVLDESLVVVHLGGGLSGMEKCDE